MNAQNNNLTFAKLKRSNWQGMKQQLKSFFTASPKKKSLEDEIDYYHQYVYRKRIERISQAKKRRTSNRGNIVHQIH